MIVAGIDNFIYVSLLSLGKVATSEVEDEDSHHSGDTGEDLTETAIQEAYSSMIESELCLI